MVSFKGLGRGLGKLEYRVFQDFSFPFTHIVTLSGEARGNYECTTLSVSLTVDSHLSVAVFLQQELNVRAGGRDVLRSGSDPRSQPVSLVEQEGKAAHGRPGSGGTSQYEPTPTTGNYRQLNQTMPHLTVGRSQSVLLLARSLPGALEEWQMWRQCIKALSPKIPKKKMKQDIL